MEINIMDYEKMVYKLINTKLSGYLVKFDTEELYSFGMEGLLRAKNNYIPNDKATFFTFAYKYVELHMRNCITRDRRHYYRTGKNEYLPTDITCFSAPVKSMEGVSEMGDLLMSGIDVENDYIIKDNISNLSKVIETLPIEERYTIVAHYFEDFSQREIAKMFNVSPSSANNYLKRAKAKLKLKLERIEIKEIS